MRIYGLGSYEFRGLGLRACATQSVRNALKKTQDVIDTARSISGPLGNLVTAVRYPLSPAVTACLILLQSERPRRTSTVTLTAQTLQVALSPNWERA